MELLAPIPESSIKSRVRPAVDYTTSGISVKIFGLPGVGKTSVFNWLANNPSLQNKLGLSPIHYLDLEQTTTNLGNKEIITEVKKLASELINDKQEKAILILDSAIVLEHNKELQSLLSQYYLAIRPRICFTFLFTKFFKDSELIKKFPLLKIPLGEARSFFPLFNTEETGHAINQWQKTFKINFSSKQKKWLISQSGGYAALNKKLIFLLKDNPKLIKENNILERYPEITDIFNRLYSSLTDNQKQILLSLATKKNISKKDNNIELNILTNLRIINKNNNLFSPLFEQYLVSRNKFQYQHFGINFSENLTASELKLLKILHKNKNDIVDRDTIAQALWGKMWQEKYSDWAIDKTVSQLRQKIAKEEDRKRLKTFRGRGLQLI